jgi:hypothetical protein
MTLVVGCWECARVARMPKVGLPLGWRKVFGSFGAEYICPTCIALPKKVLR